MSMVSKQDWEEVGLLDFLELVPSGVKQFRGVRKYVDTGSVETGRILGGVDVDFESRPSRANMEADVDDVMFAKMKATEKVYLVRQEDEAKIYSTGFSMLRVTDKSKLLPKFVYYYLRSKRFQRRKDRESTGATQKAVNETKLAQFTISLPPLEVQRRMVSSLEKAELVLNLRKHAESLAPNLIKAIFLEMFGNPVTNPLGWPMVRFSELGNLARGKSKHRPRDDPRLLGGKYPLIQTGDVANSGGYIKEFSQTYSEFGLRQSKMWPRGTLCITIAANIARTGILTFDSCFPDSVVGFTANGRTATEFVQCWLSFLQKTLEQTAPESAQKNINLEILRNLRVPVPPIELQRRFAHITNEIELIRGQQDKSRKEAEVLFETLLQHSFGEKIC